MAIQKSETRVPSKLCSPSPKKDAFMPWMFLALIPMLEARYLESMPESATVILIVTILIAGQCVILQKNIEQTFSIQ